MPNTKECLKPHALMHSVLGIGLGLLLVSWFPTLLGENTALVGFVLVVVGVAGEFVYNKKKGR